MKYIYRGITVESGRDLDSTLFRPVTEGKPTEAGTGKEPTKKTAVSRKSEGRRKQ